MRCYRSANDWAAVRETATQIVDNHPDTPWAGDARVNLGEASVHVSS
jgi:hypothetical protein